MATPFHAELVTPERVLFSGEVEEVTMRTDEGEISFLAAHEDYVAAADVTVVRLSVVPGPGAARGGTPASGGAAASGATPALEAAHAAPGDDSGVQVLRAAVHGGFVQVDRAGAVILASVAELAGEIDLDRARRSLEAAQAALPGGDRPADQILAEAAAGSGAGSEVAPGAPAGPGGTPAPTAPASPSPAMLALLAPDSPEMRARRARARLEAAGVS